MCIIPDINLCHFDLRTYLTPSLNQEGYEKSAFLILRNKATQREKINWIWTRIGREECTARERCKRAKLKEEVAKKCRRMHSSIFLNIRRNRV